MRILTSPHPAKGLRLLQQTGLLKIALPEFEQMVGLQQGIYHNTDVFEHTLRCVEAIPPEPLLRLAAFFHDIGKINTQSVSAKGDIHFINHELTGADLAGQRLRALHFDNATIKSVKQIVTLHMRPMFYQKNHSDRAVRKLLYDLADLWGPIMEVNKADRLASAHPDLELWSDLQGRVNSLEQATSTRSHTRPLNGAEVMSLLSLAEGKTVGQILQEMDKALIAGKFLPNDKEKARQWLLKTYSAADSALGL